MDNIIKLSNEWNIYYNNSNDWTEKSFIKLYQITDSTLFWKLYNNIEKLNLITDKHLFLMKNNILPIWENAYNKNGGCWSFKISENQVMKLWEDLSIYMVCEELCPTISNEIVGLSVCIKKHNVCVIKIWNINSKNNSLKLINKNILEKWGINIIYIAHIT